MEQHRADLTRERLGSLLRDMTRGVHDELGAVLNEVADGIHELELVGEQLRRRNLLHFGNEMRRRRDQGCIGVGKRRVTAEHHEMLTTNRYQHRVSCPVRSDDPYRFVRATDSRWSARAVDAHRERFHVEREIDDAGPSSAPATSADQAEAL